jgi:addiction module RelE/StbE family toxin
MARLIWSEDSISDLEGIYDYIARDSPLYARHQAERISDSIERLLQFPDSGRHLPEFQYLPHREVIVDNYRVIYRYDPESDEIVVVSIVHGRRLLTKDFINRGQ